MALLASSPSPSASVRRQPRAGAPAGAATATAIPSASTSAAPAAPDDPQNVVDALTAPLTGAHGDCSEEQGHLGVSVSANGETVGVCTNGDAVFTGGNDGADGCTGSKVLP